MHHIANIVRNVFRLLVLRDEGVPNCLLYGHPKGRDLLQKSADKIGGFGFEPSWVVNLTGVAFRNVAEMNLLVGILEGYSAGEQLEGEYPNTPHVN